MISHCVSAKTAIKQTTTVLQKGTHLPNAWQNSKKLKEQSTNMFMLGADLPLLQLFPIPSCLGLLRFKAAGRTEMLALNRPLRDWFPAENWKSWNFLSWF